MQHEVIWRQGDVKLARAVDFPHQRIQPVLPQGHQVFRSCDHRGPFLVLAHIWVAVLNARGRVHEHHVVPSLRGHTPVQSRGQLEHHRGGVREFRGHHGADCRGDVQGKIVPVHSHIASVDAGAPRVGGVGHIQIVVHVNADERELNFLSRANGVWRGIQCPKGRELVDDHTQGGVGLTSCPVGQGERHVS